MLHWYLQLLLPFPSFLSAIPVVLPALVVTLTTVIFEWPALYVYQVQVQRKSNSEHAQNAQVHISLRVRKVSSRPLLSIHTFCRVEWFSDSKCPD